MCEGRAGRNRFKKGSSIQKRDKEYREQGLAITGTGFLSKLEKYIFGTIYC